MPVYSMTGYATLQTLEANPSDLPHYPRIGLELRSVNSRFLDLSFKLSDELRGHESSLREILTKRLRRGKVELRAFLIPPDPTSFLATAPTSEALAQLKRMEDDIRLRLPNAQSLSVADVLRIAGSMHPRASSEQGVELNSLVESALNAFSASRAREGARLSAMLLDRSTQLRTLVTQALPLVPALVKAQQQRFQERFSEALKQADSQGVVNTQLAQERSLTEAAAFAIRIDVAEELTRLAAHLDEIDTLLIQANREEAQRPHDQRSPAELGKRLDFLIQELHREANTLGSKSSTLELTRISVDMKVLIEQMREQVQNIE